MKSFAPIALSAAIFSLTACDEQKTEDAKAKTVEAGKAIGAAAKSTGELAKDAAGKGIDKAGQMLDKMGDKIKHAKDVIKEKTTPGLESFKSHLNGYSEMMKQMQGAAGDSPAKLKAMAGQLMSKLSTISTDGVPEETKTAFRQYHTTMQRILTVMRSIPDDAAGQARWEMDNSAELQQLEKDSIKAAAALKDAAAKHGLTGLDLGETK